MGNFQERLEMHFVKEIYTIFKQMRHAPMNAINNKLALLSQVLTTYMQLFHLYAVMG